MAFASSVTVIVKTAPVTVSSAPRKSQITLGNGVSPVYGTVIGVDFQTLGRVKAFSMAVCWAVVNVTPMTKSHWRSLLLQLVDQ